MALQKTIIVERQAFTAAARCMYFLMRKEIPHTYNFADLIELARKIGCTYLNTLQVEGNIKYQSFRTMQEMVWCLGETVKELIVEKLRSARYFSVLIDETTDVFILKQLIIYTKFVDGTKRDTVFLTLEDLFDGKAVTIVTKIKEVFEEMAIPLRGHLVAHGNDGESVMVGRVQHSGWEPLCGTRTSLGGTSDRRWDRGVYRPEIKKTNTHLNDIFKFYDNSPVCLAALKEIQTVCENPQLKLKQPKAMRWFSYDKTCDTLRQILPSVIVNLEREAQEKGDSLALGLAENDQTLQFVATLHTMCDILPQLSILSKCFHVGIFSEADCYSGSHPGREIVITWEALQTDNGDRGHPGNNHFRISRQGIYDLDTFKQKTLCEHYDGEIDPTATMQEFSSFKLYLHKYKEKKFDTILSSLLGTSLRSLYLNLARLAEICLVIPASTADRERGFSAMKRVKTDLMNRLSQKILNAMMMVSVQVLHQESSIFSVLLRYGAV
ncbi:hypothetical protein ScPMuIL_000994 [Solemya velum]